MHSNVTRNGTKKYVYKKGKIIRCTKEFLFDEQRPVGARLVEYIGRRPTRRRQILRKEKGEKEEDKKEEGNGKRKKKKRKV